MSKTGGIPFCLFALTLVLSPRVQAQSPDDVHVVPRIQTKSSVPSSGPDIVPAEGKGELYSQAMPLRVNVDLVLVPVTVTDLKHRPVMTLGVKDFAVYEDEKLQPIRFFSLEAEPISIAILFDVSRSMTDKIELERAALVEFCRNADPRDEYFAIAFSKRPLLLAASTESVDDVQEKLTAIVPGGPTAMLDAIYMAQAQLRSAKYKRRAILIITDGADNASRYTMRDIKRLVQESDVEIYAIGLFESFFFNTFEEFMGRKWLREITDRTGGHTITIDSRQKLPEAASEISRDMRSRYLLGYLPSGKSTRAWRNLRVQLNSPDGGQHFRAYYKNGYYTSDSSLLH